MQPRCPSLELTGEEVEPVRRLACAPYLIRGSTLGRSSLCVCERSIAIVDVFATANVIGTKSREGLANFRVCFLRASSFTLPPCCEACRAALSPFLTTPTQPTICNCHGVNDSARFHERGRPSSRNGLESIPQPNTEPFQFCCWLCQKPLGTGLSVPDVGLCACNLLRAVHFTLPDTLDESFDELAKRALERVCKNTAR